MKKIALRLFFAALVMFGCARIYYRVTDDFRMGNITYRLPHRDDWEVEPLSEAEQRHVDAILNQEFFYIGKGAQAYAFVSADGSHVLKFFKFKHMKPSPLVGIIPSIAPLKSFKKNYNERKQQRIEDVFAGYLTAYNHYKYESGMLFLHLNRTKNFVQPFIVYDKLGIKRSIDPNKVVFVLQKKAVKTREVLRRALEKGNIDLAKKRMSQIFNLYASAYAKGIYDKDHGVLHNTGFIGDEPIHMDVGKMTLDDNMKTAGVRVSDFEYVAAKFDTWIKYNYPHAYPELSREIKAAIAVMAKDQTNGG